MGEGFAYPELAAPRLWLGNGSASEKLGGAIFPGSMARLEIRAILDNEKLNFPRVFRSLV